MSEMEYWEEYDALKGVKSEAEAERVLDDLEKVRAAEKRG